MIDRASPQGARTLVAFLSCVVLVVAAIALLDRPAATWSHAAFQGADPFRALTHIVDPVLPLATLGLVLAAAAASSGWRPGPHGRTLIACCLAALVAVAVKDQLKFAFGRMWPETWVQNNPSWIKDGAYGFIPFHGGTGWSSFPSGHMTDITAPMAVLWQRYSRWRALIVMPVVLVAIGLFGADFHFVGDMIAGTYLGAACGVGILVLVTADARGRVAENAEPRFSSGSGPPSDGGRDRPTVSG